MGLHELNPLEQALELAVAANARVMALQEVFVDVVVSIKYPEGLSDEERLAKLAHLGQIIEGRVDDWLPLMRKLLSPPPPERPGDPQ